MSEFLQNVIETANVFVEMFLIFLYFSLLSKLKWNKQITAMFYVINVAVLSTAVIVYDNPIIYLAVSVAILFFTAFVVYKDSIRHNLLWIITYLLIISVSEPIVIGILCIANIGTPNDFLQAGIGRYLGMVGTDIIYLWLI